MGRSWGICGQMSDHANTSLISRRALLVLAGGALILAPHRTLAETQTPIPQSPSNQFALEFDRIVGTAQLVEEKLSVELPEVAENGNFVPITIAVDSPMSDLDYVRAIHILSTANPVARIGTFRLSPLNAVARVQSRIRLAKTQEVVVLAERSSGDILLSATMVNVTIGGCAG